MGGGRKKLKKQIGLSKITEGVQGIPESGTELLAGTG